MKKLMRARRVYKYYSLILLSLIFGCCISCNTDDDDYDNDWGSSGEDTESPTPPKKTKPTISTVVATTDMTEFNIIFKVKANDDEDNVSVTLYYGSSESSMTKTKTCSRYYGGSATATKNYIFFKSFVMGSSKSKIYYKGKVQNSVGSAETSTSYTYYK
ncbi:hypothetical protein [Bacteroides salyersiae]|uniref:hypothetical protein n=1 Tax=Bacteroides salyersiae TaxID=291644 RepID=UPI001C8C1C07|nr:hypothetical protein [Bacteroides salyersiae]